MAHSRKYSRSRRGGVSPMLPPRYSECSSRTFHPPVDEGDEVIEGLIIGNQDRVGSWIIAQLVCSATSPGRDIRNGGAAIHVQHFNRARRRNICRFRDWGSTRLYAANMRYAG